MYEINYDYTQIMAGTSNMTSPAFMEANEAVQNNTPDGMNYMKNFIISIEKLAAKDSVKDQRIAKSKGNIKQFQAYDDIKTVIDFLSKNLSGIESIKDCISLFDSLEDYQHFYTQAYEKNCHLLVEEYENGVYLLVTGLSMILANNVELVTNGSQIRIQKKAGKNFGVIQKTLKEFAKQLKAREHKTYLEEMIKATQEPSVKPIGEMTLLEARVSETLQDVDSIFDIIGRIGNKSKGLLKAVKKSFFGIIPLVRSIIYLRYKKKADHIIALEQAAAFIKDNIEQLKNNKSIDPAEKEVIIEKQKALAIKYMKKAEKLRAQLCEEEKDASQAIKEDNPKLTKPAEDNKTDDDDDFTL